MPAWFADARFVGGLAGKRLDPPARHCRVGRPTLATGHVGIAPATQRQRGDAGIFRGKLQPAARRQGKRRHLANHRGERLAAQPFLHGPEHVFVISALHQDEPFWRQPAGSKAGAIEIFGRKAPQHPLRRQEPCQDARDESGGGGTIFLIDPAAGDLMQRSQCQAAAGQGGINRRNAKRQNHRPHLSLPCHAGEG